MGAGASRNYSEKKLQKAGKDLPKYNKEFNIEGKNQDYTRTQYMLIDTGTLPTGNTKQQLTKAKTKNWIHHPRDPTKN